MAQGSPSHRGAGCVATAALGTVTVKGAVIRVSPSPPGLQGRVEHVFSVFFFFLFLSPRVNLFYSKWSLDLELEINYSEQRLLNVNNLA